MENIIKRSDISEEDVFKNIRDSAVKTQKEIDELNTELVETAKILSKDISKTKFVDTTSINKATKAFAKANKMKKDSIDLDKQKATAIKIEQNAEVQLERIKREKLKTEREEIRTKKSLSLEQERIIKQQAKVKKAIDDESNAYKKLSKNTRDQKNESKRLAVELIKLEQNGKRNTKEFKNLSNQYRKVTKSAQAGDKALKRIDKTVGDNFRNVGNYNKGLAKLRNGLGAVGLAFGGLSIVKGAFGILESFDEKIADIVKTTGLSKDVARELSQELLNINTKTSVENLQELASSAGRLGIQGKEDILGFVKSADQAFVALGDDLGGTAEEIATNLGKIASTFGDEKEFGVEESILKTGSSLNELSANSKASAGNIFDFTTRLAGISSQAGIAQSDVQALGALFDESGQSIEVASSTLAKVLPALSSDQERFAKVAGLTAEEFSNLLSNNPIEALKQVAKGAKSSEGGLDGLVSTLEDFGITSARSAGIVGVLANGTERLTELQEISNEAFAEGTSLTDEFNVKNETLGASVDKLKKEFQKLVLGIDESGKATGILKTTLDFLGNNLGTILSLVRKAVVAWLSYRAVLVAIQAKNFIFNGGLKTSILALKDTVKGLVGMKKATKGAGQGMNALGKGMKSIPFIAIIGLAMELGEAFFFVASGLKAQKEAEDALKRANEGAEEDVDKLKSKERKSFDEKIRLLDLEKRERIALTKGAKDSAEQILKIEEESLKERQKIANSSIKTINKEREAQRNSFSKLSLIEDELRENRKTGQKANAKRLKEIQATLKEEGVSASKIALLQNNEGLISRIGEARAKATQEVVLLSEANKDFKDVLEELVVVEIEQVATTEEEVKSSPKRRSSIKKVNSEFSDQIELLEELNSLNEDRLDLENELRSIESDSEESKVEDQIQQELEAQKRSAETTGEIQVDNLEALIDKKAEIQKQAIKRQQEFEIEEEKRSFQLKFQELETELENERIKLLSQKNLTEQEIKDIEAGFQREKSELNALKVEEQENLDLKIEIIHRKSGEELKGVDREVADSKKSVNDELIENQIIFSEKQADLSDKDAEKLLKKEKQLASDRKEIAQAVTDFMIQQSQKRVDALDKEISSAESEAKRLETLADNGNIKAEQSLAEQNRIIIEAERKKSEELKSQQRIQMINNGIQTYNSKIEEGSDNPLAETIRDISLLQSFLSSIPAFYEGTDTTVSDSLGAPQLSGRDGHVIRVDGKEKILNPTLSDMTGPMTTSQIAEVSQDFLNGKLINKSEGAVQISGNWQSESVIRKLDSLEQTIKNKPETSYNFEQLADKLFAVLKTEKRGNDLIHNKYRKEI